MFCALSGEAPKEPVVSKKTGHLYERSLIEQYLAEHGKDPVSGEAMTADDDHLVSLKLANKIVKPRPPTATSIPTLLSIFQNEWDALMLETYQLKHQFHETKQELSNALYENDAAKRVIARLIKERDEARHMLAEFKATSTTTTTTTTASTNGALHHQDTSAAAAPMDVDESSASVKIPADVVATMDQVAESLTKVRRKRKPASTLTPAEDIEKFKVQAKSSTTHSAGIVAMDILSNVQVVEGSDAKNWLLLGGKDGKITVRSYNPETGESDHQVATLAKAHSKQVNVVSWASTYSHPQGGINEPGMFVSGGADKTVKIWDCEHKAAGDKFTFKEKHVIKGVHTGEITGLSVHASGKYVAACGAGSLWSLSDLATGQVLAKSDSDAIAGGGYSTTHFHPDGLILGLGGADSSIRIWDVKSLSCVSTFTGHSGGRKINSIAFSENGYYLASTAHGESVVKLWDLRKLVNFHTIELGNAAAVSKVSWDESGMYLGVGYGSDVRIFLNKSWKELSTVSGVFDAGHAVHGVKFGKDAKHVFAYGADSHIVSCGLN